MNKYLFTDGICGVKELQSQEELQQQIDMAPYKDDIMIWIFSSHEWISYATFSKKYQPVIVKKDVAPLHFNAINTRPGAGGGKRWLKKFLFFSGAAAGVFLIFNFTKVRWTKAVPVNTTAARPANVPLMDIDSLIRTIEAERGLLLDRSTRTNLRLRNTWPDRIGLRLNAERETSNGSSRYFNTNISIDNTTGFSLDEAVVNLHVWKNGKVNTVDTLRFANVGYDRLSSRQLSATYRGDSIAVSFASVRAKAFNFCYSEKIKNNSGNYNDRWFCRQ